MLLLHLLHLLSCSHSQVVLGGHDVKVRAANTRPHAQSSGWVFALVLAIGCFMGIEELATHSYT